MKDCICNPIFDNMKRFNCINTHTHKSNCATYSSSLLGKVTLEKNSQNAYPSIQLHFHHVISPHPTHLHQTDGQWPTNYK